MPSQTDDRTVRSATGRIGVRDVHFGKIIAYPQSSLIVNGRYDFFYGVETSQIPLFRLLGTKESDKRHVVWASGHIVPRELMIKHVLDWLDRYLGPVDAVAAASPPPK